MSKFNFEGWNVKEFIKGRRELLVALVGGVGAFVLTQNPALSAIIAALSEAVYAVVDYYVSK